MCVGCLRRACGAPPAPLRGIPHAACLEAAPFKFLACSLARSLVYSHSLATFPPFLPQLIPTRSSSEGRYVTIWPTNSSINIVLNLIIKSNTVIMQMGRPAWTAALNNNLPAASALLDSTCNSAVCAFEMSVRAAMQQSYLSSLSQLTLEKCCTFHPKPSRIKISLIHHRSCNRIFPVMGTEY
jgi:hypothetical protein